ncbi:MAG: ABC transporter permease [Deltaproteobacteria bacterium]|jgi:ABC-2 type transport system permease protein|nr:ABC transporter permease [Deltaproteobacteria bacterium]
MRIVIALMKKEFLQIARDPSAIAIAFFLPLLLLFIFGYGISLDTGRIKFGIACHSESPEAAALVAAFANSPHFETTLSQDVGELSEALNRGEIRGLLVIPPDFAKNLAREAREALEAREGRGDPGRAAERERAAGLIVATDGTENNGANFVRTRAVGVVAAFEAAAASEAGIDATPLISAESRYWYNGELSSRHFVIPGSLSIVMTLVGLLLTALVVAREWERGTMESLMSTPAGIRQIVVAKLLAYYVLGMFSAFLCFLVAVHWYGIPFRGSVGALALLSSVFLVSALGQGLFVSTVTKDQYLASQVALVTGFLPSFLLSGFIFEIASMPVAVRAVTRLVSARYYVSSLQTIFLAGDVWSLFLRSMLFMGIIGLVFFLITTGKLKKKVA